MPRALPDSADAASPAAVRPQDLASHVQDRGAEILELARVPRVRSQRPGWQKGMVIRCAPDSLPCCCTVQVVTCYCTADDHVCHLICDRVHACLGVRQVVALVVVQREAQAALVLAQVVAHEVRVPRQVDRLQRQPPQPLPPVDGLWRTKTTLDGATEPCIQTAETELQLGVLMSSSRELPVLDCSCTALARLACELVAAAGQRKARRRWRTSFCADAAPPLPGLEPCSRASRNDMASREAPAALGRP